MHIMPPCVVAGAAVALAAIYFSPPSVAGSFHRTERAAGSSGSVAPGTLVDRSRKGDRLPVLAETLQPALNVNVEAIELRKSSVVLRGRDGALLFRSDQRTANTVVAKGILVPEITVPGQLVDDHPPAKPGTTIPAAPVSRGGSPAPVELPVGCESAVSAMARSPTFDVTGRCMARDLRPSPVVVALR